MKKPMMLNAIQKVKMAMMKPMMAMKKPLASKDPKNFGMLSVKAGIDNNPNPTKADRIAGATMKKRKPKMAMKKPRLSGSKEKQKSTDVGDVFSEYKDKKITFDDDKITKTKYKETKIGGKKKIKVKKKVKSTLNRKKRINKDGSVVPKTTKSKEVQKPKLSLTEARKKNVRKKPVNKKGLAKRKAIIKKVRKAGEAKVSASYKKPKMMKKVPKGNMTLPKLSDRKKKRIENKVGRKTKAAVRKMGKIDSMKKERMGLAKELMKKYGKEDYEKIRNSRKFVSGLPDSDKRKIRKINNLYAFEQQKGKAVKRKSKKIVKLQAKLR